MGLDNPIHIAFLLILLLLVFGAKRVPEMGRSLGGGLRGFRDSLSGEHDQRALSVHQGADGTAIAEVRAAAQPVHAGQPAHASEVRAAAQPVHAGQPVHEQQLSA